MASNVLAIPLAIDPGSVIHKTRHFFSVADTHQQAQNRYAARIRQKFDILERMNRFRFFYLTSLSHRDIKHKQFTDLLIQRS